MQPNHKLVLLIDSDIISNFFNQIVLKKSQIAEKVISLTSCYDAIDFITPKKTLHPVPEIIFMDLKTPLMNGWEFIEKYNELEEKLQKSVIIIFTDDLLKDEQVKLSQYPFVKQFTNKSLDYNVVNNINNKLRGLDNLLEVNS